MIWGYIDLIGAETLVPGTNTEPSYWYLLAFLVPFLPKWKEHQRAQLTEFGLEQTNETPVVADSFGEPFAPNSINRFWRKRRAELAFLKTLYRMNYGMRLRHRLRRTKESKDYPTTAKALRYTYGQEIYAHVDLDDMKRVANWLGDRWSTPLITPPNHGWIIFYVFDMMRNVIFSRQRRVDVF